VLPPEVPADNPPTAAKVELGKKPHFDTRISTDGTVACVTVTIRDEVSPTWRGSPLRGHRRRASARATRRRFNAAFLASQFWDGRAATLEDQAVQPLINSIEHGFANQDAVLAKLKTLGDYPPLFQAAFGSQEISTQRVGQAIASFERTLLSLNTPIDRFLASDANAISRRRSGWGLYNGRRAATPATGASTRRSSPTTFHNIGVMVRDDFRGGPQAAAAWPGAHRLALGTRRSELVASSPASQRTSAPTPQLATSRHGALTHDGAKRRCAGHRATIAAATTTVLDGGMRPLNLDGAGEGGLVALMETFTAATWGVSPSSRR
jgi:cytochrome c peroxidase